jgi:hypothetical protein
MIDCSPVLVDLDCGRTVSCQSSSESVWASLVYSSMIAPVHIRSESVHPTDVDGDIGLVVTCHRDIMITFSHPFPFYSRDLEKCSKLEGVDELSCRRFRLKPSNKGQR